MVLERTFSKTILYNTYMNFRLSFDLLTIEILYEELYERVKNSLVDKIYQIGNTEVFFHLYSPKEGKYILVISVHPQLYRFQYTKKEFSYPQIPPPFSMFLRKHLEGSKIIDWQIIPKERIIEFTFKRFEESKKRLIVELMGKYSNIILINEEGIILDAIKHVSHEKSKFREIIPGRIYLFPPKNNKIPLTSISEDELDKILNEKNITDILYLSPLIIDNISRFESKDDIKRELLKLKDKIQRRDFNFLVYFINDHPYSFSLFPLDIFKDLKFKEFKTLTETIDFIYSFALENYLFEQLKKKLNHIIDENIKKVNEKKKEFIEKIKEGESAEDLRIKGEILLLYQKDIKKGTNKVILPNPYSEKGEFIEIEIDPSLSVVDNAQKYFKKYKKLKRGLNILKEQLEKLEKELYYLNSLEYSLDNSDNLYELQEIEEELINGGYIRENKKIRGKKRISELYKLTISDYEIYVGKNNKQNDYITFNLAKPDDLWFHARGIPGAHVILRNKYKKDIPEDIILQTAIIAGYFSKGRNSSYIPVDYTKRKYVQKPKDGKPGFVIYRNEKTIFVKPDDALKLIS